MYVRSLVTEEDVIKGGLYPIWIYEDEEAEENPNYRGTCYVRDGVGDCYPLSKGEWELVSEPNVPALTSTTHVLKIEHKFKVTKTIDNMVQLELQHGVYSKDNVQELIDILVKVKEEM